MSDAIKKRKEINTEMEKLKITVERPSKNPHYNSMKHKGPIASLSIPNKLYML